MRKNVLVPAVAGLVLALSSAPAIAQKQQKSPDPDPAMVHALVQQALQQVQPIPPATDTSAQAPFVTPGPRVNLTVDDAVQRGREKNIDIAVARITPRLTDFTIAGLQANYNFNLTGAANSQESNRFPTSTIQGISTITPTYTEGWSSGLAKNMWWGGGSWQVSFTNTRTNQQATNAIRNPTFQSGISATYLQPLLRGFKVDATRAALKTNVLSQQNDEISLQSTTYTTEANVRNAYWDLVYAIQAVEAAQGQLDLANRLVKDNQARVEIGTLAPIDVVSAQSEAANRRQTLVAAEATVRTSELSLKRLIVSGTDDPLWTSSLNPVDRPPTTAEPINLEAAVTRALQQRTDLQQSLNNLKISDINIRQQIDLTRPQLNLTATYGLQGLGGTQIDRVNNITIPSGYWDALSTLGGWNAPQWNVALNFSYPLGISAQESTVARSKLQLEQTQANLKALQLQIATDVTSAALTVQSDLESVQASGVARELAKQKLDAAMSKAEVGMATNYEVVQAQRDFADSQNAELLAILNYRKALVNFEAAQTVGSRAVSGVNSATGVTSGTGTQGGGGGTATTGGTGSTTTGGTGGGGF